MAAHRSLNAGQDRFASGIPEQNYNQTGSIAEDHLRVSLQQLGADILDGKQKQLALALPHRGLEDLSPPADNGDQLRRRLRQLKILQLLADFLTAEIAVQPFLAEAFAQQRKVLQNLPGGLLQMLALPALRFQFIPHPAQHLHQRLRICRLENIIIHLKAN
ncbi:hypothetical protein D3C75_865150 [compost metagenome]